MSKIITSIAKMKQFSLQAKKKDQTIGFVPTMGYLHDGHLALVKKAKEQCDIVVVSIFVNPTQFGPKEDLKKYPRDLARDKAILNKMKVDAIFYPAASSMYPIGYSTFIEVAGIQNGLCGALRPGHFRGVATIVMKLFNIVKPDVAYFGRKDYQQQTIIKKMANDLNMDIKIIDMPTIREMDGLAMSSRNKYLNSTDRKKAAILSRALRFAKELAGSGIKDTKTIKTAMVKLIKTKPGIKIDYINIVDPSTLKDIKTIRGKGVIALAAYLGKTRLIDNIEVQA
jgi:pantoate--beta-alanine ligase